MRATVVHCFSHPPLQPDVFRFPIMDLFGEVKNEVKRRLSQIEVMNDEYLVSQLVRFVDT